MPSHAGLLVGYGRTSTIEQRAGLEAQLRDLKATGCKKVFQEQVSSIGERAQLQAALDYLREGDTLVVISTRIDTAGPSTVGSANLIPFAELCR
jgi:DNA invertase Pin-like site-specific DNA recombinase